MYCERGLNLENFVIVMLIWLDLVYRRKYILGRRGAHVDRPKYAID